MTILTAIENLETFLYRDSCGTKADYKEELEMAIEALKEKLQQEYLREHVYKK